MERMYFLLCRPGYWAEWRLRARVKNRWAPAISRAILGVLSAVAAGVIGAVMSLYNEESIPYYLLGTSTAFIIISLMMLILTIYEFVILSKLESEIHQKAENKEKKAAALESIRKDDS